MHPDLERLIRLQALDIRVDNARRTIAEIPARRNALEMMLKDAGQIVESARTRLAENQQARRTLEKDLAVIQGRLSRFKDQLMEVKTNKEYQAMQKEIAAAEHEVRSLEDRILERMLAGDELARELREAEAALAAEETAADQTRAALERERAELEEAIQQAGEERQRLTNEISAPALALFDHIARGRKGVAVSEARDGHCTICHVRLRPQVFNDVRRNDGLIQCESCQRILYFAGPRQPEPQNTHQV